MTASEPDLLGGTAVKHTGMAQPRLRLHGPLLVLVACALIGPFLDNYQLFLLGLVGVYVIFSVGYNLLIGFAGQLDFGQAAFLGIGAYTTALLQHRLGLTFWLSVPLGGFMAVAFGLTIGALVLRLSGFYLALVTLAFNQAVVLGLSLWTPMTGGFQGISVPRPQVAGLRPSLVLFYAIAAAAVLLVRAGQNLIQSRVGKGFVAMRDSEVAAEAMGVNLARSRVTAYAISAWYGGIAGGLFGGLTSHITPQGFGLFETIRVLTMIVVGGLGSIAGSVGGAALLVLIPEVLRASRTSQEIANGLLLFGAMLVMPEGLAGLARHLRTRITPRSGVTEGEP